VLISLSLLCGVFLLRVWLMLFSGAQQYIYLDCVMSF
jgi:hypothetical protein